MTPHRRWAPGIALAAVLGTSALTGPPASAAPTDPGDAAFDPVQTEVVTLLTGDRVTVSTGRDGQPSYVVTPAAGAERQVQFLRSEDNGDTYLIPSDVAPLMGTLLDRELFNVTDLVADGFSDEATGEIPLILRRDESASSRRATPLHTVRGLPAIGGAAAEVDKSAAPTLGRALAALAAGRSSARAADPLDGVTKIWLDGRVKAAALDANLTQIGAPEAWASGLTGKGVTVAVLDSGIDATHPDLVGQVDGSRDFTDSPEGVVDKHGHGTHVASTIVGTGAAAPGIRSGVAPGADLLVGKVLNAQGEGTDSGVIAGMTWAAEQGADVVNMSLGAGPTDGTDAVSTALNELSDSSGALFVVAAGNSGPGVSSVSAPSVADRALSVAAVDATDTVAAFSSRGPRLGGGVKPEIAAPGVNIWAARAAGTGSGSDPYYLPNSGTSMASPHVAGSAVLVAQAHPGWTGQQLKAALMTAARPKGRVNDVGAGVVDIPAAVAQTLLPAQPALSFGIIGAEEADPVTHTITFTNTGDTEVVADVTDRLSTSPTQSTPTGLLAVSPSVVTIPAGQSAEVTVTVSPEGTPLGVYDGEVVLTPRDPEVRAARVPMTLERSEIATVEVLGADGNPVGGTLVSLLNLDTGARASGYTGRDGMVSGRVLPGRYAATTVARVLTAEGVPAVAVLTADEVGDSGRITLDAAKARTYSMTVEGQQTRPEFLIGTLVRRAQGRTISAGVLAGGAYGQFDTDTVLISPTDDVAEGSVVSSEHWRLANADSTNGAGDATEMYDLAFVRDEVAARPTAISRSERADLAAVRTDWKGPGEARLIQEGTLPQIPGSFGLNASSPSMISLPVQRTLYTNGGVMWRTYTYRSGNGLEMHHDREMALYEVGGRYHEKWYGGPFTASALAQVRDRELQLRLNDFVDSGDHLGRYADFRYPPVGSNSLRITRNGQPISRTSLALDLWQLALPDSEDSTIEVARTYDAADGFPSGGQHETTWRFKVPGGTTAVTPVAVPNLHFNAALDDLGRARAGLPLPVHVAVSGTEGAVEVTGAWTVDGGRTWTPADVSRDEDAYSLLVPSGVLASGQVLGLRVEATDAAGSSIRQSLLRAVPVI